MQVRRREVLVAAAVTALFYAIGRLTLDSGDAEPLPEDRRPPWVLSALADMKATQSPGLAIVLPPGAAARDRLRSALESVLDVRSAPSCLVEAVFLVADPGWVGARPGETLALLDAEGRRAGSSSLPIDADNLEDAALALLRADGLLERRAKAARTPEVAALLECLDRADQNRADAAMSELADRFAVAGPAVIESRKIAANTRFMSRCMLTEYRALRDRLDADRTLDENGASPEHPLIRGTRWHTVISYNGTGRPNGLVRQLTFLPPIDSAK